MPAQQAQSSKKDAIALAIIIEILCFLYLYYDTIFPLFFRVLIGISLILSFVAGMVGRQRKIGFIGAFYLSLFLSPAIGFIITFISPSLREQEFKEKMLNVSYNSTVADQLLKLNELKEKGALTEEEFNDQKKILLSRQTS